MVANAYAGYGFPAEAPVNYIFPSEMFTTGSDLTPLEQHMEELLSGLTDWEPETKELGLVEPDMIEIQGKDWETAITNFNNLFRRNMWSDSFAVEPPTEEKVNWILKGTDLDPDTEISPEGGILPRGGIATVRGLAVFMAMAGGRPEYMPLFIAMVQAQCEPAVGAQGWNATTNTCWPTSIVNGTIGKQIRLSSGYGLLGPDPVRPAGGCICRAMRLMQQDLGGSQPGNGTMSLFGACKTTNSVFAEDEDKLTKDWPTFGEERGFKRGENVVTITLTNGLMNVFWDFGAPETNYNALMQMAKIMAQPCKNKLLSARSSKPENADQMAGVVMLPNTVCTALNENSKMSKEDVKQFLWENSKMPWEGMDDWAGEFNFVKITDMLKQAGFVEGQDVPFPATAKQLTVVCAGGDQGGHGFYMKGLSVSNMCTKKIQLPKNWDELLLEAEIDLGPAPTN